MDYRSPRRAAPLVIVSNKVSALDRETGEVAWKYLLDKPARKFLLDEERLIVLDGEGNLHWLDAMSGRLVGVVKTGLIDAGAFLFDGERFYVSNDTMVVALDANGRELWRRRVAIQGAWGLGGMGVPGITVQPDARA